MFWKGLGIFEVFFSIKSPFNLKKQGHFWKQLGILRPFFQIKSLKSEKSENYFETLCSLPFYFRRSSHNFVTSIHTPFLPLWPPPSPGAMHQPWNRICNDLVPIRLCLRRNWAKISINSENSFAASGDEKSEGASEFFQRTLAHVWGQTWRTSRRFLGD